MSALFNQRTPPAPARPKDPASVAAECAEYHGADHYSYHVCGACLQKAQQIAKLEKVIMEAQDLLEQYAPAAKFRTWEIASRC